MLKIKKIIKRFFTSLYFVNYNKKHKTRIYSSLASRKAVYGHHVGVEENTVVMDDVSIGKYSYINKNSYIENCSIGNYCCISSGVYVCPFEHDINRRTSHPFVGEPKTKREAVTIGHDVLISLNVIVLKGVNIGNGAVIAAGAVVTKDVLPYEIVGGVPAKHIGWRFSSDEIKRIELTHWWDFDIEQLSNNYDFLRKDTDTWVTIEKDG